MWFYFESLTDESFMKFVPKKQTYTEKKLNSDEDESGKPIFHRRQTAKHRAELFSVAKSSQGCLQLTWAP